MIERTPIGFIHNVPVYGRLPERFLDVINKVESITLPEEWNGIKYVCSCDDEIELSPDNPEISGGNYVHSDTSFEVPVGYNDGTKEIFIVPDENIPVIFLNSGFFKSEYWLIFTLLHELGHHNDPDKSIEPSKEKEIFAHLFALDRVSKSEFYFLEEQSPKFYNEAKKIWNEQI